MARLTAAARKKLPKSDFGVPSKAPGPGSYPMPDKAHAAVAKGRATTNAGAAAKKKIDAMADKKLGIKEGSPADLKLDKSKGIRDGPPKKKTGSKPKRGK